MSSLINRSLVSLSRCSQHVCRPIYRTVLRSNANVYSLNKYRFCSVGSGTKSTSDVSSEIEDADVTNLNTISEMDMGVKDEDMEGDIDANMDMNDEEFANMPDFDWMKDSETAENEESSIPELKPIMNESISGELQEHLFQAETKQLLEIVSNSLYTDKEVFLRELLSNASDSMEKIRYEINRNSDDVIQCEIPLEINIFTDKDKGQIIIQDYGIGMDEKELQDNIGIIARSGSKAFVNSMTTDTISPSAGDQIIGQFGVGFYSVFMISDNVAVYSLSAMKSKGEQGYYWSSDGAGSYSMAKCNDCQRGVKVVINVKSELQEEFLDKNRIEGIIKKYSSYLEYPIKLNGSLVTSTGAIWAKKASEVKDNEYQEFYQLISNRYDTPFYIYHTHIESSKYNAQVLLYFPETHSEKFGSGRLKPGVNLYCKKVLVKKNAEEIVPDWLRFIHGAVDSENIPIHISRENMQDSQLIKQLQESLMMKVTDYLKRKASSDGDKYLRWYNEFSGFIKEGVCTDYKNRSRIAKLLRFSTNKTKEKEKISLDEYIDHMNDGQTEIFYLMAPNYMSAMNSPYMESFLESKTEVLLCFAQIDEFCMKNLGSYRSKEIVGIETSTAVKDDKMDDNALSEDDCRRLGKWLKTNFPLHIEKVEATPRLKRHPSVLVDHQSAAIRQYLHAMGEDVKTPPQRMQINPGHNIIKGLYDLVENNESKAMVIAQQMINNAFVAAGILDDPREMLVDMNSVMELALGFVPTSNTEHIESMKGSRLGPNQPRGKSVEEEYEDRVKEGQEKLEEEYGISAADLEKDPLLDEDSNASNFVPENPSSENKEKYSFGVKK